MWQRRPPGPGAAAAGQPSHPRPGRARRPSQAVAAARAYLAASDVTGTVQLRGGTAVIVHTAATYHTKFLGIIGIDQMPVTGSAESRIVRAVKGRTMTTFRRRLTGLLAAVLLVGIIVGLPATLLKVGGNPLPEQPSPPTSARR